MRARCVHWLVQQMNAGQGSQVCLRGRHTASTVVLNDMLVQGGYMQRCPIDTCGLTCRHQHRNSRQEKHANSEICAISLGPLAQGRMD